MRNESTLTPQEPSSISGGGDRELLELWCVHIQGPDDMIPKASKHAAVEFANGFNKAESEREDRHPYDPIIVAVATVWPYSAESHAASLTNPTEVSP